AQALAAHFAECDFDAALVADDAAMLHAFVFAAQTFPVRHRTENFRAEQAIAFRLEGAVIDGLRLGDFAMRPRTDFLRTRQADADGIEIGNLTGAIVRARTIQGRTSRPGKPGQKFVARLPKKKGAVNRRRLARSGASAASSIRRPNRATAARGRAR